MFISTPCSPHVLRFFHLILAISQPSRCSCNPQRRKLTPSNAYNTQVAEQGSDPGGGEAPASVLGTVVPFGFGAGAPASSPPPPRPGCCSLSLSLLLWKMGAIPSVLQVGSLNGRAQGLALWFPCSSSLHPSVYRKLQPGRRKLCSRHLLLAALESGIPGQIDRPFLAK